MIIFNTPYGKRAAPYKHLFFDLDHTLWDFETNAKNTLLHLYNNKELKAKGINDFDSFYKQYLHHNDRLWERYRNGFITQQDLRYKRMFLTLLDFKVVNEALTKQLATEFLELLPLGGALFPYTKEILDYLTHKGYQLHLITNGFEDVQYRKLDCAGLRHYFNAVITSEAANSLKPHKEIFDYALQCTGAVIDESIMIGDNIEADILGARNAGWEQVFVNHINEKTDVKPTYIVEKLIELEQIF